MLYYILNPLEKNGLQSMLKVKSFSLILSLSLIFNSVSVSVDALMPQSVFNPAPSVPRLGPVYYESDFWDEELEQRKKEFDEDLIQLIQKSSGNLNIVDADQLIGRKGNIRLESGIEIDSAIAEEFFGHLISSLKYPTFVLVLDEHKEKVASLIRNRPGSNLVVILPYKKFEREREFEFKTVRTGFVNPLTLLFEEIQDLGVGHLKNNVFGFKDNWKNIYFWNNLPSQQALKSSLPLLASFPILDVEIKKELIKSEDENVLEELSIREDLDVDDIEALIDLNKFSVLQNLLFNKGKIFSNQPYLAKKLIDKLFENREDVLELILDFTSKKTNLESNLWLLNAVTNYFYQSHQDDSLRSEKAKFKKKVLSNRAIPVWIKGHILERMIRYGSTKQMNGLTYASNILHLAEESDFWEEYQDLSVSQNDVYSLWLRVVVSAPGHAQLREGAIIKKLERHHRLDALLLYETFLKAHIETSWKELLFVNDYNDVDKLISVLNKVLTSKIPNRGEVFWFVEPALLALEENSGEYGASSFSEFVDKYGVDFDQDKAAVGIDIAVLLIALVLSEGSPSTFESLRIFYSYKYVRHSRDLRNSFINEMLLSSNGGRRNVVRLALSLISKDGNKNRKDRQKKLIKSLQLLNMIYFLNREMSKDVSEFVGFTHYIKTKLLSKQFESISDLHQSLFELVFDFVKEDFSTEEIEKLSSIKVLSRLKVLVDYLKYKRNWNSVHPKGVEELRKLVSSYLFDSEGIKAQKYGENSDYEESLEQMNVYQAVLEKEIEARLIDVEIEEEEKSLLVKKLVQSYIQNWKRDMREDVTPFEENGDYKEPLVVWSQDSLDDWLRLGQDGAFSCLIADGDPHMNKALLGRLLSATSKMKYIGSQLGDRSTRMTESLMFAQTENGHSVVLNDEQAFSNLTNSSKQFAIRNVIEAMIISAIRNAGRFGASRIVVPRSWEGDFMDAFLQYQEKLLSGFSTFIEHRDIEGKIFAREEITIKSIVRNVDSIELIGLKERNRWRHWVGRIAVNGQPIDDRAVEIVDQNVAFQRTIAGVTCHGIDLTFNGIEIELEKKLTFWSPNSSTSDRENLPDKVKELFPTDRSVAEDFQKMKKGDLNAAQYLSYMYAASDKVIQFMKSDLDLGQGRQRGLNLVVAIPRGGVPVARALKQNLPKRNRLTGVLRAKNGAIISKFIPKMQRKQKKNVFLVDEVIVSGRSIINSIAELLNNGIKEKEIIVMTLGAKREGLESVLKQYPDLQAVYVGVIEDEERYETVGSVSGLIKGGELSHPMNWDEGQQVRIYENTYQLLYRIESKKSFNLFLGMNKSGEKVVIKTTVGEQEKNNIYKVVSALWRANESFGFVKVVEYDAGKGAMVMEYIEGVTAGKYFLNGESLNSKAIAFYQFLKQYKEMVQFLHRNQLYFVNFDVDNFKWDPKKKKWAMTNLNVFPYSGKENGGFTEEAFLKHSKEFLTKSFFLFFQAMGQNGKGWKREAHSQLRDTQVSTIESFELLLGLLQEKVAERFPRDLQSIASAESLELATAI